MKNSFDIMKVLADDSLAWVEAAEELSAARLRVWELLAHCPGEYIVFNQETKTLVAHFSIHQAPQTPEWWRHDDEESTTEMPLLPAPSFEDFDEYFEVQPAVA